MRERSVIRGYARVYAEIRRYKGCTWAHEEIPGGKARHVIGDELHGVDTLAAQGVAPGQRVGHGTLVLGGNGCAGHAHGAHRGGVNGARRATLKHVHLHIRE
jgi:hypothetical protein